MSLDEVWDRLCRVRTLTFTARSGSRTGWNGCGSGTVLVEPVGNDVVTYTESGVWRPVGGRELRFSNVFRWSRAAVGLRLEHLRFGENHPVYLFDLSLAGEGEWRSASPHLCREDCYAACMRVHEDGVVLAWSIDGPQKQEQIEYAYSW